jgi:hypothetical protein
MYDCQPTTTKDSPRNSALKRRKQTEAWKGCIVSSQGRRKDKESERSTDLAVHNQILKQLNGRNHHIPTNINTECQ